MKNSEALINEIKAILAKYNAEIEIVDNQVGYSSDPKMQLSISSKWSKKGELIQDFEIVDLGRWIDKD